MMNNVKTCIKCDETKELTQFRKDKNRLDGYRNVCLTCHNKKRVGYNKTCRDNREAKRLGVSVETLHISKSAAKRVKAEQQEQKTIEEKNRLFLKQIAFENSVMVSSKQCFMCSETKSVTEFYPSKRYKDGYEGRCKECNSIKSKRYEMSDASKKHKQEYDKQYRQEQKAKSKEKSMELKDQDKILTRIETEVTAETLADSAEKMKIYLMALLSIAYEAEDDKLHEKIMTIHEAMKVEVNDVKVVSQSLEYRAQEVTYHDYE